MNCQTPIIGGLLHKWGKWEMVTLTYMEVIHGVPFPDKTHDVLKQLRSCKVCGKQETAHL